MNISSEDVFTCITDYGIDELSYKLEEYIEQYIAYKDLNHSIAASKALEIISKGIVTGIYINIRLCSMNLRTIALQV